MRDIYQSNPHIPSESPIYRNVRPFPAEQNPAELNEFENLAEGIENNRKSFPLSNLLENGEIDGSVQYLQDLRKNIQNFYQHIQKNINNIENDKKSSPKAPLTPKTNKSKLNKSNNISQAPSNKVSAVTSIRNGSSAASILEQKQQGVNKVKSPAKPTPKLNNISKLRELKKDKSTDKLRKAASPSRNTSIMNEQEAIKYVNDLIDRFKSTNNLKSPKK